MKPRSLFFIIFLIAFSVYSQKKQKAYPFAFETSFFYGNIWEHNPTIQHLITGHPTGFMLSYNQKSVGFKEWERRYNYPDVGVTGVYQNTHNPHLGDVIAVFSHINWYFFNRSLRLGVGQGVAYAFNPYDSETNFQNTAYGTHMMPATLFSAMYIKENLWKGLGFHAGVNIIHLSNGNLKAPNTSTNTIAVNVGINYLVDADAFPEYITKEDVPSQSYREPLKFSLELRGGINESDVIGLGQHPFYVFSAYVDKRINYKSTFQTGVDVFYTYFLKDYIKYRSIAYPEEGLSGDEDFKRIGMFVGHEWRFYKVSMIAQLGYYIYYPFDFENRIYARLGIRRYLLKDHLFVSVGVKSHWAKAEALEFGLGYRF